MQKSCLPAQFPEGHKLVLLVRNSASVDVGIMNCRARQPWPDRQIVPVEIDRTCRNMWFLS